MYVEALSKRGKYLAECNSPSANRQYTKSVKSILEIRKLEDKGKSFLIGLLDSDDYYVALGAATHLLPLDQELALQTIYRIADTAPGAVGFEASMIAREWEAGRMSKVRSMEI